MSERARPDPGREESSAAVPGCLPVLVVRPYWTRIVVWVMSVLLVAAMVVVGLLLKQSNSGTVTFQTSDQVAMIGLGVLAAAAMLVLTRPYVKADERGVEIRNLGGVTRLPWQVIRSVRFSGSTPWATLELADDDTISVLAIQEVDRLRAVRAIEALRDLHRRAG